MMASSSAPQPQCSTVPSASHACACSGLADERQKVTMPGSPQRSTISPSGPASAAQARCRLSTVPPRRAWTRISGCWTILGMGCSSDDWRRVYRRCPARAPEVAAHGRPR